MIDLWPWPPPGGAPRRAEPGLDGSSDFESLRPLRVGKAARDLAFEMISGETFELSGPAPRGFPSGPKRVFPCRGFGWSRRPLGTPSHFRPPFQTETPEQLERGRPSTPVFAGGFEGELYGPQPRRSSGH